MYIFWKESQESSPKVKEMVFVEWVTCFSPIIFQKKTGHLHLVSSSLLSEELLEKLAPKWSFLPLKGLFILKYFLRRISLFAEAHLAKAKKLVGLPQQSGRWRWLAVGLRLNQGWKQLL